MNTIHLEPSQVPAHLRGAYTGRKFRAEVCETYTVPMDAGLWSGGTRETFHIVRLADGAKLPVVEHNASPWSGRQDVPVKIEPGFVLVRHSMFCGRDMGLTFHVHPADAVKMLPEPVELSAHERLVLEATGRFKASYNGQDRYQMAAAEYAWRPAETRLPFPSRAEWDAAKASLVAKGLLNRAGAITVAGKNARSK